MVKEIIDITSYAILEGVWVQGSGKEIPCANMNLSQKRVATAARIDFQEGKPATTNSSSSQYNLMLLVLMGTDCC